MRGLMLAICWSTLGALWAGPALAAREFPADARPAEYTVLDFPIVKLDKETLRLAPGAQVRDESNLIIPAMSRGGTYTVLYTRDTNGDVFRVWILTAEELALFKIR